MSLTQKQLSQGQTTYNPLAGAIVLTSLLTLLQYFIEQHITVINRLHACTYALPTIILGLITSLSTCIPTIWIICSITMLILCIVIVWMSKQIEFNETPSNQLFSSYYFLISGFSLHYSRLLFSPAILMNACTTN